MTLHWPRPRVSPTRFVGLEYDGGVGRVLLGELFVNGKVITREQLDEVLAMPRVPGKKIGQILIEKVDLFPNGAPNALRDPKAGKDYLCYDPAGSPNAALAKSC